MTHLDLVSFSPQVKFNVTTPFTPVLPYQGKGSAPDEKDSPPVGYLFDDARAIALAEKVTSSETISLQVTRAEIFLTNACNMECLYCLSIKHPMPKWDDARLYALIQTLAQRGTRHLQWTGGEVTVVPGLKKYISWAKEAGMTNSISTNGMAGLKIYRDLIEAGVSHFSISFDSPDPAVFDHITQTKGKLPGIRATIEQLCAENTAHAYRIVVNSVLTPTTVASFMADDAHRLREFLAWCVSSGVDDFKFLPASTEPFASLFPSCEVMEKFIALCVEQVPAQYKCFFYRLSMMQRGGHGLRADSPKTCYHSLDDRAYDSLGGYPCIIHLREGGARLSLHEDSDVHKRQQLAKFLHEDRTADPICQKFCFDVYRALNERVSTLVGTSGGA
ncbi:MAG: radical SAM protein [Anaerolineales bacterium]|nr:radical SAM protein [Anaerolineales bacterium]